MRTCRLFGPKPLSEPMLVYSWLDSWKQNDFSKWAANQYTCTTISCKKMHSKVMSAKWQPFCRGLIALLISTDLVGMRVLSFSECLGLGFNLVVFLRTASAWHGLFVVVCYCYFYYHFCLRGFFSDLSTAIHCTHSRVCTLVETT